MRALVLLATLAVVAVLGCAPGEERPEPSQSPTAQTATPPSWSLADLPTGAPPRLAYVRSGSSVVFPDRSVDLEWQVESVSAGGLVWDADKRTIHRVGEHAAVLLSSHATSPPVFDSTVTWIEDGAAIVREYYRSTERQPLPAGCCRDARLIGVDVDVDPDVFVAADKSAWMWDTYEGREGLVNPPPDSEDYFWPVGGLGHGTLTDVGISSEILIKYPDNEWGWGYVAGPRDPSSDDPVRYEEQERVSAVQVWLTSRAIVALEPNGRLVVLAAEYRYRDSRGWRTVTGERTAFELPDGLEVQGVVAERSSDSTRRLWTVLVDATDRDGRRAWVRCNVHSYACEIAAELGPDDITPE
jgi:hypothetical protein